MKTDTRKKILEYIKKYKQVTPHAVKLHTGLSGTAIHKQLKKLEAEHAVRKIGKPPRVLYVSLDESVGVSPTYSLPKEITDVINKSYLYVNPDGVILEGTLGFFKWAEKTKQSTHMLALAQEYVATRQKANQWYKGKNWIDATEKLKQTFSDSVVDLVAYKDFYALPKFGKTRLGALTLHAKVSQSRILMNQIVSEIREPIQEIINQYRIDAIAFVPHSVPRVLPFLTVIKQGLGLELPEIQLEKIYQGEVRVAQKSLGKLEERVENAHKTIFLTQTAHYKRVLLIDDAVGSGATLNEVSKKLKQEQKTEFVVGFAVVGSYKGFEVIQEV